jgi:NO-binding membrane sensor protein with MHYT domain
MNEVSASYNLVLLALSFIMAVFGSFTALQLALRIPMADKQALGFWVLSSGIALGGGAIWSMHFIGMLAMNMPFPMQFDLTLTFLSFIIAIIFVSLGLAIAGRDLLGEASLVFGGAIAGLGVASMHYIGMYAMKIPASIAYDPTLVIVSIVIAIVAAIASLWLAFNLRGMLQRFGSAIIMGIAVCGMHYTGMYAATMTPNEAVSTITSSGDLSASGLAGTVTFVTVTLLFVMLYLSYVKTRKVSQLA